MKRFLLAASLVSVSPALALQVPTPGKADPRVCDVTYNPNDVTDVSAVIGNTVTIRFAATERIVKVTVSDMAHLKRDIIDNVLYLKPTFSMSAQPIAIRTLREDGTPRDYTLQWTALPNDADKPHPVALASTGTVKIIEVSQEPPVNVCYLIRYNYPSEFTAAQVAAWRQRQAQAAQDAAEIALRDAEAARAVNKRYVGQGDASIGPTEISDDGYTTTLRFPGNTRIPVILTRTPDGKESEVTGTTMEQGGVAKIHGTLPFIRLRDGDLVLCITNRAWSAVGNNPGTGTTSSNIERSLGGH